MNQVYLVYRYDEYGDKEYLRHKDGYPVCVFDCESINDVVCSIGGGWDNGWKLEIFYNPIQD